MPNITIIKAEFADEVKRVLGGLSSGQGSTKTGVSYEYLRRMTLGHVPSEAIIERFARGMTNDPKAVESNLHKLRIAAGYEPPPETVIKVDDMEVHIRVVGGRIREESMSVLEDAVRESVEYGEESEEDEP